MHMGVSITMLTLLLPHIAINCNIASSYIATTPAFQYIFQMYTVHPSYNICELLSTIVGNLAWPYSVTTRHLLTIGLCKHSTLVIACIYKHGNAILAELQ